MSNTIQVKRKHEICMGHRVVGHEGKCRHLHGHNYVFHFVVEGVKLDTVGRVIDFSVVKSTLCEWLEENWDHKFMHWKEDTIIENLHLDRNNYNTSVTYSNDVVDLVESYIEVDFNPTAENIAHHFLNNVAPKMLEPLNLKLVELTIEETSKCHVTVKSGE